MAPLVPSDVYGCSFALTPFHPNNWLVEVEALTLIYECRYYAEEWEEVQVQAIFGRGVAPGGTQRLCGK